MVEEAGIANPDENLTIVKSRAAKGVVTLAGGSLILGLIQLVGVLLITTFLGAEEFGLYAVVGSIIVILGYFSDIGLAASLIQKKESITKQDLQTTFTIQQGLVLLLISITLALTPFITSYYKLTGHEVWLLYALLGSFFISSLKTIPSVMLERALRFDLIMITRIVEVLVFNIVAVGLAVRGFGVLSYVPAVIGEGLVGLVLLYIFKPWPVGLAFSKQSLHKLLKFGLPFQTNSFLAVAKDQFVNLFLWKIVGAAGMGYVNWGYYYSQLPQGLIIGNATRVAFPAMSRMQDHPAEFRSATEKLLRLICVIVFPILVGIALMWSHLAFLGPKWFKWQPALVPLYLYCFSAILSCFSTPLTNTLYAMGRAKIVTYLMVMWLILEWLFKPALALRFGFVGIAYATAIIGLSSFVPFFIAKKIIGFSIWKSVGSIVLATIAMSIVGYLVHPWGIVWTAILPALVYIAVAATGGKQLFADVKGFYTHFRAKI